MTHKAMTSKKRVKKHIELILNKIKENCEKDQYWNAISLANDLQKELLKQFDAVLKRIP